jgi:hypothetical protein
LRLLLRIKQRHWIAPEQKINNYENEAAKAAAHGKASAAGSANIFNILAFSSSSPKHRFRTVARFTRVYNLRTLRFSRGPVKPGFGQINVTLDSPQGLVVDDPFVAQLDHCVTFCL